MATRWPVAAVVAMLAACSARVDGPAPCATWQDCDAGFTCHRGSGVCVSEAELRDAGAPLGTACGWPEDCATGFCASGRCCTTACVEACERCDVAGREGVCTVRPLGTAPEPECPGFFACNGVEPGCPSRCDDDAGCVQAACAADGVCVPKFATLSEDFEGGAFDASVWSKVNPGCAIVSGQLAVTTTPNSTVAQGITSRHRYDLLGSHVAVELANAGEPMLASVEATLVSICSVRAPTRCVRLHTGGGAITLEATTSAIPATLVRAVTADPQRGWRVREQGARLALDMREDGGAWVELGRSQSQLTSAELSDAILFIGARTAAPEAQSSTVIFDNVNGP